jgi:hypothetical protein
MAGAGRIAAPAPLVLRVAPAMFPDLQRARRRQAVAAVIDARTLLDGLTDHDHGHPNSAR